MTDDVEVFTTDEIIDEDKTYPDRCTQLWVRKSSYDELISKYEQLKKKIKEINNNNGLTSNQRYFMFEELVEEVVRHD